MPPVSETKRLIRNMLGVYSRIDGGHLNGRNSESTDRTLDWNWSRLQVALHAGGFEELDADPKLAARYHKLERRHLLGARSA